MHELTVSAEQAHFIAQAGGPLIVVDERGQMLGHLTPAQSHGCDSSARLSDSELAEIKRRMQSHAPGLTTQQVLDYLHSLESA